MGHKSSINPHCRTIMEDNSSRSHQLVRNSLAIKPVLHLFTPERKVVKSRGATLQQKERTNSACSEKKKKARGFIPFSFQISHLPLDFMLPYCPHYQETGVNIMMAEGPLSCHSLPKNVLGYTLYAPLDRKLWWLLGIGLARIDKNKRVTAAPLISRRLLFTRPRFNLDPRFNIYPTLQRGWKSLSWGIANQVPGVKHLSVDRVCLRPAELIRWGGRRP